MIITTLFVLVAMSLTAVKTSTLQSTCHVQVESTCDHTFSTGWNTKNVAKSLKTWIESISTSTKSDDLNDKLLGSKHIQMWKLKDEKEIVNMIANVECENGWDVGKPVGYVWKKASTISGDQFRDGFFYGSLDSIDNGFSGDKVMYVFPDMKTVLVGTFEDSYMLEARESRILAERCNNGIKEILVAPVDPNSPMYRYKRPNSLSMGHGYTLVDPYERRATYIGQSEFAGDGVFAKRNIKKGEIISYYSGIIHDWSAMVENITNQEQYWDLHQNAIYLQTEVINILEPYRNITAYRATRGHKHNHSFKYSKGIHVNCYHPRYGSIMSVVATENIKQGQEILVNYGYPPGKVPDWYLGQLVKELVAEIPW